VRRAVVAFVVAWVGMDVIGTISYLMLSLWVTGSVPAAPAGAAIASDPVWQLSNKVLPVLNLVVWVAAGWWYLRRPRTVNLPREAWRLGGLWLAIVLPLDLLHYVVIPTPLTIGARAFYVDQFPWIYVIYAIVVAAPRLALALRRWGRRPVVTAGQ
jgi:hypothetical protein